MRRRRKRKRKSCSIFILLLSWITTLESTLAIRCFQCSDFPREKFSQDEYLGRCPGQKMTHYPSRGLYNACLEVRLRHNWTVVAQNAAIHELNCDPGSRRALQKLSTDIFRQSVSVRCCKVDGCNGQHWGKNKTSPSWRPTARPPPPLSSNCECNENKKKKKMTLAIIGKNEEEEEEVTYKGSLSTSLASHSSLYLLLTAPFFSPLFAIFRRRQ